MYEKCCSCKHLFRWSDGIGGGINKCLKFGIVVGKWGYWVDELDEPKLQRGDCYEADINYINNRDKIRIKVGIR